jgi:site-specific DNA-cytosine methylase
MVMAHGQANAEIVKDGSPSLTTNHEAPILWEMSHASEAIRENGEVVPTLQARMGTGGNQVPMVGVRRLMPIECERLQGFPDGWTDGQSDSARYKQLGNAVAVPVVEWIGKRIKAVTQPTQHAPDVAKAAAQKGVLHKNRSSKRAGVA